MNHKYAIEDINQIVDGKVIALNGDQEIYDFSIDTRKISQTDNLLFIAIKGDHNDAHDYVIQAYKKGVRNFLVETIPSDLSKTDCSIIQVKNSLSAFQSWMAFHRRKFKIPVLGITGSNGKTTVKEWLNLMLSDDYSICRSPNSFNSQVGVPLSISNLNDQAQLGIFEAGISQPNEMRNLENIIQPTLGLITNIGSAHLNNFENEEQLIREKIKLFKNCELVFSSDRNKKVIDALSNQKGTWFLWGTSEKSDLKIISKEERGGSYLATLSYNSTIFELKHLLKGEASFENMMFCISVLLHLGYSFEAIQKRVLRLKSLPMRMEILKGQRGMTIINDAYTLDLNSLELALDQLQYHGKNQKKIVVLSDFDNSNKIGSDIYKELIGILKKFNVDQVIGIGPEFIQNKTKFRSDDLFFESKEEFLEDLQLDGFENSTVLIKGSRAKELESIIQRLQQKNHRTLLEINLTSLAQNLKYFKSLLQPKVKLMVMVKAFSYGSGSKEIAQILEFNGVDYLGVAYADEGVELREDGVSIPIMVMNPEADNFDTCFRYNLEPEIYSMAILQEYLNRIPFQLSDQKFKIHLKIDTGMNRLGFLENEVDDLVQVLKSHPEVEVAGILTHLAASDSQREDDFSKKQLNSFQRIAAKLENELQVKALKHVLNTAGILRFPGDQMDMVRLGIGLYGISPSVEFQKNITPVSSFKTKITQIKKIAPGDSVGYNREFKATSPMKIAIIPVGYADGFPRSLSKGKGHVWIKNKKANILGNVCMDMCMVDITDIRCEINDEVILFSPKHSIHVLSNAASTIPYEIMTSLSSRVRRVYVND